LISREDVWKNQRLAGLVKRYHTWPVIREQNVAEHSFHIMRIYLTLFPSKMSLNVWEYILRHDMPEQTTGDPPYPIKVRFPALRPVYDEMEAAAAERQGWKMPDVTSEQKRLIKICDMIEMWEFGMEELAKGNAFAECIVQSVGEWLGRESTEAGVFEQVLGHIGNMSRMMRRDPA